MTLGTATNYWRYVSLREGRKCDEWVNEIVCPDDFLILLVLAPDEFGPGLLDREHRISPIGDRCGILPCYFSMLASGGPGSDAPFKPI